MLFENTLDTGITDNRFTFDDDGDDIDLSAYTDNHTSHGARPIYADPHENPTRLEMCGQIREFTNALGMLDHRHFYCGNYRQCARCLKQRANMLYARAWHGICRDDHTPVEGKYYRVTGDVSAYTEKIGGKYYLRLPQPNGDTVLFVHRDVTLEPDNIIEQKVYTAANIKEFDFASMAQTPYKQRMAGGLGKVDIKHTNPDTMLIEVVTTQVVTDAPRSDREVAFKQAILDTPEEPTWTEDIEAQKVALVEKMNARTEAYAKQLKAMGHSVATMPREVHVEINRNVTKRTWIRTISDSAGNYIYNYSGWKQALVPSYTNND